MTVDELDRIFDSDDVATPLAIDLVDHRGQRRRLSRTRRAGNEHQTSWTLRHLRDGGRQFQIVKAPYGERNLSEHDRHRPTLLEHIATKTCKASEPKGKVELVLDLEALFLLIGENRVRQLKSFLGRQCERIVRVGDVAVDTKLGARVAHDMEVGCTTFNHLLEQAAKTQLR